MRHFSATLNGIPCLTHARERNRGKKSHADLIRIKWQMVGARTVEDEFNMTDDSSCATPPGEHPMKILVAIDGSEAALHALKYVATHPAMFGAAPDVILVNVHLPVPSPRAKAVLGADSIEQYYREEAEEAMAPARTVLAGSSCNVVERTIVGQPAAQLIAAAVQHDCELIVMGTHGRGAFGHLFLGSVAMRVIAESPVPVLVTK